MPLAALSDAQPNSAFPDECLHSHVSAGGMEHAVFCLCGKFPEFKPLKAVVVYVRRINFCKETNGAIADNLLNVQGDNLFQMLRG